MRLTEIHRQAGSSWIVRAAHAVNRGEVPESAPAGGSGDFYFVEANDPEAIIGIIMQMVRDRIPARFGLDPFRDVQVLTPHEDRTRRREPEPRVAGGAQPRQPGEAEVKRFDTTFRVGDKVMQTQNNYNREVFNGDIGRVTDIDTDEQMLAVEFDGRRGRVRLRRPGRTATRLRVHDPQGAGQRSTPRS